MSSALSGAAEDRGGAPAPCARCGLRAAPGARYCCFGCELAEGLSREASEEAGNARGRVGIAVFLAMNVMTFSMVLYSEDVFADADPGAMAGFRTLLRWASVVAGAGVLALLGVPLARHALAELRARRVGADLLVVLAVTASFGASIWGLVDSRAGIYVEASCATLVLVTVGRALESVARRRAASSLAGTLRLGGGTVDVDRAGGSVSVALAEVVAGDVVGIAPGSVVPVDGTVIEGYARVSTAMLTGESAARAVGPGDEVQAGSVAEDGAVRVRARRAARDSTLARIEALVADARARRAPIERLVDRVAAAAIPATLLLAIGAGVRWGLSDGPERGIVVALAVVLVACPCSLGIATPLALWGALGRAASRGVLLRGCDALEALASVRSAVIDKTGTLTLAMEHARVVASRDDPSAGRALAVGAALEKGTSHPLGRALSGSATLAGAPRLDAESVHAVPGRGLSGRVGGSTVLVGSEQLLSSGGVEIPERARSATLHVAERGVWLASFVVEEQLRPGARAAVDGLRDLGLTVHVASGDRVERVDAVARELGVPATGGLLPEDKLALVEKLERSGGAVLVVGDGVNDGAALAGARVGVAIGGGADLASAVAAVTLLGSELERLPWLVALARRARSVVRQNLAWSFGYNVVCVALAASGRLSPVWAAVAMLLSSLFTLLSSLRLLRAPSREPGSPSTTDGTVTAEVL